MFSLGNRRQRWGSLAAKENVLLDYLLFNFTLFIIKSESVIKKKKKPLSNESLVYNLFTFVDICR